MRAYVLFLVLAFSPGAMAQSSQDPIVANPNRPTVADPADITQFGVAEIEYGFSADRSGQSSDGLLKFAFAKDLELRIESNTFIHDSDQRLHGIGDTGVGLQWRVVHQSKRVPTISLLYAAKVPTATWLRRI
ncbi:MAG: hypothetical protein JWO13_9 [Acidobacteriales bacterium]|nr:hypothetical protein [Terriglobales bacterium]